MKNIQLTDNEAKLLLMILKESCDIRGDMCCNDPDKNEEKLFTENERKQISRVIGYDEDQIDDFDGFLYNVDYPKYLRKIIKKQV